jgi:hypothetical protein
MVVFIFMLDAGHLFILLPANVTEDMLTKRWEYVSQIIAQSTACIVLLGYKYILWEYTYIYACIHVYIWKMGRYANVGWDGLFFKYVRLCKSRLMSNIKRASPLINVCDGLQLFEIISFF